MTFVRIGSVVFLSFGMLRTEFILYVADQQRSRNFYSTLLGTEPSLDVPGMTEIELAPGVLLGLIPEYGIARILTNMPHPSKGNGIPRCELYLFTGDPSSSFRQALKAGGTAVSEATARDWGDTVSYVADPDGHIIAFAKRT